MSDENKRINKYDSYNSYKRNNKSKSNYRNRKPYLWDKRDRRNYYNHDDRSNRYQPYNKKNYKSKAKLKSPKVPSRSPSPLKGTEEYTERKIQRTSDYIMRHLMGLGDKPCDKVETDKSTPKEDIIVVPDEESNKPPKPSKMKPKKKPFNVQDLHEKIIRHIANLNHSQKVKLINSESSNFDDAIDRFYKLKSLELSKALRLMSSQEVPEVNAVVNSIIPDFEIKLEELPKSVIEKLSNSFHAGFQFFSEDNQDQTENFQAESTRIEGLNFDHNPNECSFDESFIDKDCSESENIIENTIEEANTNIKSFSQSPTENVEESRPLPYLRISSNLFEKPPDNPAIFDKPQVESRIVCSTPSLTTSENSVSNDDHFGVPIKTEFEPSSLNHQMPTVEKRDTEINALEQVSSTANTTDIKSEINIDIMEIDQSIPKSEDISTVNVPETSPEMSNNINDQCLPDSDHGNINEREVEAFSEPEWIQNTNIPEISTNEIGVQTNIINIKSHLSYIELPNTKSINPKAAINLMLTIDEKIKELTTLRQQLITDVLDNFKDFSKFACIQKDKETDTAVQHWKKTPKSTAERSREYRARKAMLKSDSNDDTSSVEKKSASQRAREHRQRKEQSRIDREPQASTSQNRVNESQPSQNQLQKIHTPDDNIRKSDEKKSKNIKFLENDFENILSEKILKMELILDDLVTGSDRGNVTYYSLPRFKETMTFNVTEAGIIYLSLLRSPIDYLFVGSQSNSFHLYRPKTNVLELKIPLDDKIHCLERSWTSLFLGGENGYLMRISLESKKVCFSEKIYETAIMAIKGTKEGARTVLLIAARNSPICIRDAFTGLQMRTFDYAKLPTVYSIIQIDSTVYFATSSSGILVFKFWNGKLSRQLDFVKSKGVSNMKLKRAILFISCHDGNIYLYNVKKDQLIETINCGNEVILFMFLLYDKIIISTINNKLKSVRIPTHILNLIL